jgi:hypothetical protein
MGSYPKIISKYINVEGRIVGGTKKHPSLRLGMEQSDLGTGSRGLPNDPSGFPDVPVPLVYLEQHGIVNYKSWTFKIVDIYCDTTLRYSSLTSWYPEIRQENDRKPDWQSMFTSTIPPGDTSDMFQSLSAVDSTCSNPISLIYVQRLSSLQEEIAELGKQRHDVFISLEQTLQSWMFLTHLRRSATHSSLSNAMLDPKRMSRTLLKQS